MDGRERLAAGVDGLAAAAGRLEEDAAGEVAAVDIVVVVVVERVWLGGWVRVVNRVGYYWGGVVKMSLLLWSSMIVDVMIEWSLLENATESGGGG